MTWFCIMALQAMEFTLCGSRTLPRQRVRRLRHLSRIPACAFGLTLPMLLATAILLAAGAAAWGQVESVEGPASAPSWVSHGRVEGHLAISYSPAGAFSPDSSILAVVNEEKVFLMDLRGTGVRKVLKPRLEGLTDLQIQSANYLSSNILFLLATGIIHVKGKGSGGATPLLAFQWYAEQNTLAGKVDAIKAGSGPVRYFPEISYLAFNKENSIDIWNPRNGHGGRINIPDLTQPSNLYAISPDGHWLLLAQIASSSTADPVVVELKSHKFVDSLRGHQGTVLSIAFSRDSKQVATTCEDGKVRIYSVPDWKLLATLSGHVGPVHWAEFSRDGKWVVSAGEDKTVRIWSAEDGKLVQTLEESQEPLLTVAFSPNAEFVAASSEHTVLVWQRAGGNR
jgi:WD40 repeat protein